MELSVLIPWRSAEPERDVIFNWVTARYHKLMPGIEVVTADSSGEHFNRGQARNRAFEESSGDILLIADADTIFDVGQIKTGVERIIDGAPWVIPYGWYYNLNETVTNDLLTKKPGIKVSHESFDGDVAEWYEHKIVSWAGLLMISREAFEKVGGYDEEFKRWGFEDNAFHVACDTILGRHERLPEHSCYHLWHQIAEGFYNNPGIRENRSRFNRYKKASGHPKAMRMLIDEHLKRRG